MMIKTVLLIILPLLIIPGIHGQIRPAKQEMLLYNYSHAITLLEKAYSKEDPATRREAARLLAECYRKQNIPEKAKEWYLQAISLGSREPLNWYYLACCQRSCGDYIQAKLSFLKYDSLDPSGNKGKINAAFCDSVLAWQKRKPLFDIRNAQELNTPQSDFAAIFAGGKLFFASDRTGGKGDQIYGWTGNCYLKIYVADVLKNDSSQLSFGPPAEGPTAFNKSYHDGPVCFNSAMDEAFINRTIDVNDKGRHDTGLVRTHLLKIYHAVKKNGNWCKPEPFFLNNKSSSVGHPALSPDGNTLYFVSDMDGGFGGTDIWYCTRTSNGWSKPVNLGKPVNTTGNEMFPFISGNGDLYFASDGHPGFGGLDIFMAKRSGGGWDIPVNLGQPLNSSGDDFAFALWPGALHGTFSSNRPGGTGSDDIYCFNMISPVKEPPQLPPASIASEPPKPIPPSFSVGKTYRIENIFYDFDKWNIRKDAEHSLDSLISILREYPVSVEIGSHTDCRGTVEYNNTLSARRAESVVRYLVQQGIDPSRLTARGYGKSRLINRCNCEADVKCTEAEHQANRRTEFRITGITH